MGRPRQFSEPEAVRAAAGVFAHRGFAGTSVDDLVRATSVNRASLYGVFGSKDGLFRRCLGCSLDALGSERRTQGAVGAARPLLSASFDGPTSPGGAPLPRQVALDLVLVALMELAPGDRALAAELSHGLTRAGVTPADLGGRALERAGNDWA